MSAAVMKDPIEVIEMREELKKFGRVVRSAKESHRGFPRVVVEKKIVVEQENGIVEQENGMKKLISGV